MTKPSKIYVMATKIDAPPAFVAEGKFKEVSETGLMWRDNAMLLVPAQLFVHNAQAGEEVHVSLGDRDAIVLVK